MSFLNKFFGTNNENQNEPKAENKENTVEPKFFALTELEQFNTIDSDSHKKPVVLFKHSTRCSISRFALKQFDAEFNYPEDKIDWYLLDLLNHRELSNEISKRYSIEHQSPQIIVIRDGKAVFHESHDAIDANDLKQFT